VSSEPGIEVQVVFLVQNSEEQVIAMLQEITKVHAVPRIGEAYLIDLEYDIRVIDIEHNLATPRRHTIKVTIAGAVYDADQLVERLTGAAGGWLRVDTPKGANGNSL
jgi:hypothetical protein